MQTTVQSSATTSPVFWTVEPGVWKTKSRTNPACAHTIRREKDALVCSCPARVKCFHLRQFEATMKDEIEEAPARPVIDPSDDDDFWGDLPTLAEREKAEEPRPITFEPYDPKNRIYF